MAFHGIINMFLHQEYVRNLQKKNLRINHRRLRDSSNPFTLPDYTFLKLFRFNKETTRFLIDTLEPHMPSGVRITYIPNYLKIMATLHFFGHGSYQIDVGHGYNFVLSQPVVSRSIKLVTDIMNTHLLNNWIIFPTSVANRRIKKDRFFEKYHFPNCLGVIDCTHIAIIAPPENHPVHPALPYYNRKGYYSINVQIICDADLNILNMNARFPGSVHDSAIWRSSTIRQHFEYQFVRGDNSCILGDAGYPIQPWLMVPFDNANENTPEGRYNKVFLTARNTIERLNGVLKGRFRCLLKHRTLNYDPLKSAQIIYCCGILHNIAQRFNNNLPDDLEVDENNDNDEHDVRNRDNQDWLQEGRNTRDQIVQIYFGE